MTDQVVIAPLLVALATAVATLLTRPSDRLQRATSLLGGVGYLLAVAALFRRVVLPLGSSGETLVYAVSDWQAPYGIVVVADPLSAFMLGLAALVSLAALGYSVLYVSPYGQRLSYHPLYHFMLVGVTGAFLTGDVFNLFVWFEVMLMSSYILVLFYSGPEHTRAALNYVVLNLLGSAVMLVAIGGLYATTGTLNMADMARRLADPAAFGVDVLPVLGLSAVLFSVFALKAGLVPFHFWVPAAYRAAPAPVTAVLAGVVKKVGVYAIVRLYFTVFAAATLPEGFGLPGLAASGGSATFLDFYGPVLFVMATASVLFGGLGAVGRHDVNGLLAFSSIGQVGFIVLPLAVGATAGTGAVRVLGVTAALVYALNHGLAKGLLFLVGGTLQSAVGSTRFGDLGGVAARAPVLAGSFLVGALALIGVPPLTGFFAKFLVFDTAATAYALGANGAAAALAVALVGAVFTIAYFTRGWNAVFWGAASERVETRIPARWAGPTAAVADGGRSGTAMTGQVVAIVALALTVVALGVGFEFVHETARSAAQAAVDTGRYVDAVNPASGGGGAGGAGGENGGHGALGSFGSLGTLGAFAERLLEVGR